MKVVSALVLLTAGSAFAFLPPAGRMIPNTRAVARVPTTLFAAADGDGGVSEKVRSIIQKNSGDDPEVAEYLKNNSDDKAEFSELGFDSLDLAEFSMALQSEFELADMSEEDLAKFKTVQDVVSYISSSKA
uniref:Plastid acyl carrier protein n=1 Tax=Vischeria sp. CAUP Q 202 TaxID=1805947 RepID=A0A3R5WW18_9STRA|nr:plastid acyl carrier protein [Vischeria sp. CAUP Q 202]